MTTGGRITGLIMLTVGVALFATFSGFLANLFLSPRKATTTKTSPELGELRKLLEEHEGTAARLRAKLEDLEEAV